MMQQRIDQCTVEITRSGVHDQTRRLINNQQVLVLEHDGQGNILRFIVRRLRLRDRHSKRFLTPDLSCGVANRSSRSFHRARSDECLQPLAGERWNHSRQRSIQTPPRMGGVQTHVDRLYSPHSRKDMGTAAKLFNAGLRGVKLCPINRLR